jgi:hypothetical protein
MATEKDAPHRRERRQIPLQPLLVAGAAFGLGATGGILLQSVLCKQNEALSAAGVVSFVFTVALGGAAIVLAIVTLVLSRQAEDALTRRSDEGTRLQNEAFLRTADVLARIQTSTGVTEKRIEDIVSGRTNVIVQEAFDKTIRKGGGLSTKQVAELKESLAGSLKAELVPLLKQAPDAAEAQLHEMEKVQGARGHMDHEWREYRGGVVAALRAAHDFTILSEAEGDYGAELSEDFWDVVAVAGGRRIAFDIHTREQVVNPAGGLYLDFKSRRVRRDSVGRIALQAVRDKVDMVLVVFDEDVRSEPTVRDFMVDMQELATPTWSATLLFGQPDEIITQLRVAVAERAG